MNTYQAEALQLDADLAQNKVDAIAKLKEDTFAYLVSGLKRLHVNVGPKTMADGEMYIKDAIDDIVYAEVSRLSTIINSVPDNYSSEVSQLFNRRDYA